jgi:hydrogenase expression/formation protein HypC
MCLGIPGTVVEVQGDVVTLDVMGDTRHARLDLLGEVPNVGDYVLHHLGFVTAILDKEDALATLELFEGIVEREKLALASG